MAATPTLYLESTRPSYLTARPGRGLVADAHRQITHEWWERRRSDFDMYVSEAVVSEIGAGDADFSSERLALVAHLPILTLTDEVEVLANEYQGKLGLPDRARLDAVHLACAVAYELDYLVTWNCKHLANGSIIRRLVTFNRTLDRKTPIIVTPEELLA